MDIEKEFRDAFESYIMDDEIRECIVQRCIEIAERAIKEAEELNCDLFGG